MLKGYSPNMMATRVWTWVTQQNMKIINFGLSFSSNQIFFLLIYFVIYFVTKKREVHNIVDLNYSRLTSQYKIITQQDLMLHHVSIV